MLWEIEIAPLGPDVEKRRVLGEYSLCARSHRQEPDVTRTSHGYLMEAGPESKENVGRLLALLLHDPLVEKGSLRPVEADPASKSGVLTVLPKPGVMDPVALSVMDASKDLGVSLRAVRTFRRYYLGS